MKRFVLYGMAVLGLLSSCAKEEGPSPEDSVFAFDVPKIQQTQEYPVGVFYINVGSNGQDAARYSRLQEKFDPANGRLGFDLDLTLGNYGVDQDPAKVTDLMVENIQQEVDWCIAGGVDFWILPAVKAKKNAVAPDCLEGDNRLYDIIRGAVGSDVAGSGKRVDMKQLKFAATINVEDPLCQSNWETYNDDGALTGNKTQTLSNTVLLNEHDDICSWVNGRGYKRSEMFVEFIKSCDKFFKDEHYYRVDGRPMVVLQNAHKLYTSDCAGFWEYLRSAVLEATGEEPFFVGQMDPWTPPARYQYFFTGLDAVAAKNMYNNSDWTRYQYYPQAIYLNFEYCLKYFRDNMGGIDFIPTGAPAWNKWIDNQETDKPLMQHDPDTWRETLNILKGNAGQRKIVFIDSFNQIQYGSFIAPTKEDYGNGYGTLYLDIIKDEMDVN